MFSLPRIKIRIYKKPKWGCDSPRIFYRFFIDNLLSSMPIIFKGISKNRQSTYDNRSGCGDGEQAYARNVLEMTLHLSLVVTGNKNTMKDGRGMGSHRNDRERERQTGRDCAAREPCMCYCGAQPPPTANLLGGLYNLCLERTVN